MVANDTHPDIDTLSVDLVASPANGTAVRKAVSITTVIGTDTVTVAAAATSYQPAYAKHGVRYPQHG